MTSINQYTQKIRRVDDTTIEEAAALLKAGKLVAFATETVYGLGGDASNDTAVARIFQAKGRPQINPLIVHVTCYETARIYGIFNAHAQNLAKEFWPGALTLVVPKTPDCPASLLATAGLDTIALRVPAHPTAQALLRASGMTIAAPSANRSGHVSASRAQHVVDDLGPFVDLVLDDGPVPIGLESTIIACLDNTPCQLRPGGLPRGDIEDILGCLLETGTGDEQNPLAPGQLASHYAPNARIRLNAENVKPGEALLAFGPDGPQDVKIMLNLSERGDLVDAAAHLFEYLRILDGQTKAIAVMPIPDEGLGEAINDRLARAAAARP